jgi:hypothetical protein
MEEHRRKYHECHRLQREKESQHVTLEQKEDQRRKNAERKRAQQNRERYRCMEDILANTKHMD